MKLFSNSREFKYLNESLSTKIFIHFFTLTIFRTIFTLLLVFYGYSLWLYIIWIIRIIYNAYRKIIIRKGKFSIYSNFLTF